MMIISLLIPLLLTAPDKPVPRAAQAAPPSRWLLETVEGATLEGEILAIDNARRVVLRIDGAERAIPLDDLTRIARTADADSPQGNLGANCTIHLSDGGVLEAKLLEGAAGKITVDIGINRAVTLPISGLAGIRFNTVSQGTALTEFSSRLKQPEKGRDLLLAVRDGGTVVLPGVLESLTSESWSFRIGRKVQTGALDRAFGVILGGVAVSSAGGKVRIRLDGRREFSADVVSADPDSLELDAGPLGRLSVPWRAIRGIDVRSERVVFISDLEPVDIVQYSVIDASWPPQKDRSVTGLPLIVDGRLYERGLGVHATTRMTYALDGAYASFVSTIGIDDAAGPRGRAVFRVICDGRVAYESSPVGPGAATAIRVPTDGVNQLILECDPGPDLDISDHCDWAGARLIRAKRTDMR
ncbi:MAG: NPCBM/NEW2 domain-containing protein [Planctomycetia bacterium]|nr:NPCBM/NEW2 domain-containing protein [Planctomycetia bacterium]MCC7316095.1 NPCBM/NEW2 domain-containing protein [Planctomycetota bacterium]